MIGVTQTKSHLIDDDACRSTSQTGLGLDLGPSLVGVASSCINGPVKDKQQLGNGEEIHSPGPSKNCIHKETQISAQLEEGMSQNPTIKTFVILDLESSALGPGERPKITEICMVALHRSSIENSGGGSSSSSRRSAINPVLPRVLDKLTLCIYPNKQINIVASDMTKLDNVLLSENEKQCFNNDIADCICAFLKRQAKPICMVAHNGDEFDFPLLRTELAFIECSLPCDILCVDSLKAFRELDNEQKATKDKTTSENKRHIEGSPTSYRNQMKNKYSYKLQEIYQRSFGKKAENIHNAESDVIALVQLLVSRGGEICKWMDRNSKKWPDVKNYYCPSPLKKYKLYSTCIEK